MKTLQEVVDQLNVALQRDPQSITSLVNHRVPINEALAEAEDCSFTVLEDDERLLLGLVGVLNGFRDTDDPAIVVVLDSEDESKLLRFALIGQQ